MIYQKKNDGVGLGRMITTLTALTGMTPVLSSTPSTLELQKCSVKSYKDVNSIKDIYTRKDYKQMDVLLSRDVRYDISYKKCRNNGIYKMFINGELPVDEELISYLYKNGAEPDRDNILEAIKHDKKDLIEAFIKLAKNIEDANYIYNMLLQDQVVNRKWVKTGSEYMFGLLDKGANTAYVLMDYLKKYNEYDHRNVIQVLLEMSDTSTDYKIFEKSDVLLDYLKKCTTKYDNYLIEILLKNGASITSRYLDDTGTTESAYKFALKRGDEETVKLILPYLTIDQKFLLYVLDNKPIISTAIIGLIAKFIYDKTIRDNRLSGGERRRRLEIVREIFPDEQRRRLEIDTGDERRRRLEIVRKNVRDEAIRRWQLNEADINYINSNKGRIKRDISGECSICFDYIGENNDNCIITASSF